MKLTIPLKMINSNGNFDPNSNFFNEQINSVESTCYTHEEFVSFSSNLSENLFYYAFKY